MCGPIDKCFFRNFGVRLFKADSNLGRFKYLNPLSRVLLEKLVFSHPFNNFLIFYGTW